MLNYRQYRPVILLATALIIIAGLGIGFHGPIDRQMRRWKLLPQPERLTELYFSTPNRLPATYKPGQSQTVSFTVHNLEYKTVTYHYTIEQVSQNNNHKLPLASGSFTLAQNGYAHPQAQITLGDLDRSKVEVNLFPVSDDISYWLTEG